MSQPGPADPERDLAIFHDFKTFFIEGKMSMLELTQKYGITSSRIYQVIDAYCKREGIEKPTKKITKESGQENE